MKLTVNKNVITTYEGNESVMLNMDNGKFYGVDHVGTALWNMIESGFDENQLIDWLIKNYEIDLKTAQKDISIFIKSMIKNGIFVYE